MTRLLILALWLVIVASLAAQESKPPADADSHDKIVKEMIATLKSAAKVFADAKDADSAKKAKPDIEKLATAMQAINERIVKLPALTKPAEAELEKKYKAELDDTVKTYQAQVQRLLKETWGKDLVATLEKKPAPKPKDK